MKKIYMILAAITLLSMSLNAQTRTNVNVASNDFSSLSWWTVIDANSDNNTWYIPTGSEYAEYMYHSTNAADDWLVTSPITLEAGKTYTFSINAWRSNANYVERIEVMMADANTAAALSAGTTIIAAQDVTATAETNVLSNNQVTVSTTGTYYFGIHCISIADRARLRVDNLLIETPNTNPLIIASPSSVSMSALQGGTATKTVTVAGENLTEGITASISGTNASVFSVNPASVDAAGGDLTISYSPTAIGTHTANLTLSSTDADPVTIALNGECTNDLTLCDGTNTSTYLPVYGTYTDYYQINQMIYPATDLTSLVGKNITSMTFYANSAIGAGLADGTWTIKLGTTTQNAFEATLANNNRLVPDDIQEVVSGYHFTTGNNTLTIEFDTPFTYNGNNLLIDFQETAHTSNYAAVTFYGANQTSVTGFNSRSGSSNNATPGSNGIYSGSNSGTRTFLPKVTFTAEDLAPRITASPETLTINDSGTNNTFDVQGSNLGTDNVGVTVPNGSEFSTTTTDQGWGFIPNNGSISGTVTVTYGGRALSATETVTATNNTGAIATVTVNYRADLYIVGDFGNGWDFATGTLMTYNATNNTYTANVSVNADNLILFARKLGESNPWNTRLVFGPNSDGDWWVNGDNATGTIDLNDDDPIKFVNAGTYTIEINATTGVLTISALVLPPPENVVATPDGSDATVTWDAPSNPPTAIRPYTEDFEDTTKFPSFSVGDITDTNHYGAVGGWTLYDSTGAQVYGDEDEDFPNEALPQAWMVFNSTTVGAPAYSGVQYMESICPLTSYGAADSWLISPELSGNAQTITFYERVLADRWGNELYEVLVSSTDNNPASFTSLKPFADVNLDWTLQSADLPAGTKYFAIRHYSNDVFGLLVDNVTYEGAAPVPVNPISYNVYLDGVLVGNVDANDPRTYDFSNLASGEHQCAVSAVYEGNVESELVPAQFTIVPRTDAPTITVTPSGGSYVITATGNGTVTLTVGDQTVSGEGSASITIPRTDADQTVTATATAQETGKLESDATTREITIPALPTDPTPEGVGLLRLHLLFCDQLKANIPDDNSHPDAYGYVLKWEPQGEDAKESGRVKVNIQKTDCEVMGYYTLDQIDRDTNRGLTMDVLTADVEYDLSSSNDMLNYYYLQGKANGYPTLDGDYLSKLYRQEDFTYREMYEGSYEFDHVFNSGEHHYFNSADEPIIGSYGDATKFVSYAPSVTTWGIQRRYFELDGKDNTYGAPVWKTAVGQVLMDTQVKPVVERQTNKNNSVNWGSGDEAASLYILDNVKAIGYLPPANLTKVEFEPYMFRIFVESKNGLLRPYKVVEAVEGSDTEGEHLEAQDGELTEADTKGPICVWSGYINYVDGVPTDDAVNGVELSYDNINGPFTYLKKKVDRAAGYDENGNPLGGWDKDSNNAMFGALDALAISGYDAQGKPILNNNITEDDLKIFVRFYYSVKGELADHTPWTRAEGSRSGNGSESGAKAPEPATGVSEIAYHGEVVGQTYYNIQGMESDQPFDGVNIVVTRYSDGATSISKVIR